MWGRHAALVSDVEVPWWVAAVTLLLGAVVAAVVKVAPVISQALTVRSERAIREEAERVNAALRADSHQAKQKLAENQQVFDQQQKFIAQLAEQIDRINKESNEHVRQLYAQIGALRSENERCEERCRVLDDRVRELEATVGALKVGKGGAA